MTGENPPIGSLARAVNLVDGVDCTVVVFDPDLGDILTAGNCPEKMEEMWWGRCMNVILFKCNFQNEDTILIITR